MDAMLTHEREHTKGPFAFPHAAPYRHQNINDRFPRSFQHPLVMASPLPNGVFAVWPPSPRATESRPAVSEARYQFSVPEESSTIGTTAHSWDEQRPVELALAASHMAPSRVDVPNAEQYGSQSEGEKCPIKAHQYVKLTAIDETWRSRVDFSMLGNNQETTESSNFDSSNGYLVPYQYALDSLRVNTNLDNRRLTSGELSSAEAVTASTASYYGESDTGSLFTEYRTPLMSAATTPLSPSVRSVSRSVRGSCSPSNPTSYRVSPYSTTPDKSKRWSAPGDSTSPFLNLNMDPQLQGPPFHSHHSSPVCPSSHAPPSQQYLQSQCGLSRVMGSYLPATYDRHDVEQLIASPFIIPPHSDNHGYRYAEYSERPDLHSCLVEEQMPPPEEDMNPEDPDMKPHEQDLRFEGDLYTPRWVRGHGNKREGWCGICKPGRWLVLKNSAFWYDKSFSHGISAATCLPFNKPLEMRRMDGNPDIWEGHCHSCNDWVPLVSNKKKVTTWFRHAYKCHTHNKVRDGPKRRRESSNSKGNSAAAKAKVQD
ncbi:hypothetical protein FN846DRAFT_384999 [Sphaerosporella brunnea]|uniref:Transcription regulator Rua1 C-terminal domain-containing protein n=1 Tax=Sphaerosporella brunnea TaxID=1250544 RepID=A0A5J5EI87_9PEZI|nr:hypothetical protein FN846DRAFT_384999 [Sphaerosporella brunnea]